MEFLELFCEFYELRVAFFYLFLIVYEMGMILLVDDCLLVEFSLMNTSLLPCMMKLAFLSCVDL